MRQLRRPNCKHTLRDMDFKGEKRPPGMLVEYFFCRICRREMVYVTKPRASRKHDAELAVTALVRDPDFRA